jgi:hypothetical protein
MGERDSSHANDSPANAPQVLDLGEIKMYGRVVDFFGRKEKEGSALPLEKSQHGLDPALECVEWTLPAGFQCISVNIGHRRKLLKEYP